MLLTPKSVTIHIEHQSSTLLGDTKSTQSGGKSSEDDRRDEGESSEDDVRDEGEDSEDDVRDKGEGSKDKVRDKGESGEDEGRVAWQVFGKIKHHMSLRFFFSKSESLLISSHRSILVSYRHLRFSYTFTFAFSSHLHQDH